MAIVKKETAEEKGVQHETREKNVLISALKTGPPHGGKYGIKTQPETGEIAQKRPKLKKRRRF